MNTKEFAKKVLTTGALIYTAFSACILLISAFVMGDSESVTETSGHFLDISTHLFTLIFAYFASITTNIAKLDSVPSSAKVFIEGGGFIAGFFFFLVLPMKKGFTSSIMLTLSFTVIYVIVKALISILTYDEKQGRTKPTHNKKKKNYTQKPAEKAEKPAKATSEKPKKMKDEEYTSLFSSKSDR